MTDNKMPDEIWAWKPELEAYKLTFEIIGSEYTHKKPAVKYHHDDKYQTLIKENDEANSLLGDMSVFLDNLLADISRGYEHVGIDWEKYAREEKAKIEQHLNRRKQVL